MEAIETLDASVEEEDARILLKNAFRVHFFTIITLQIPRNQLIHFLTVYCGSIIVNIERERDGRQTCPEGLVEGDVPIHN